MKSFMGGFIGLVLSVSVGAEPLLEGRVHLSSGQPAAGVQVRLFDLTDLRRSVGTTTDAAGYFALSLQAFSTARGAARPADFALGAKLPQSVQSFHHHSLSTAGVRPCAFGSIQYAGSAFGNVSGCGTISGSAYGAMGWDRCGGAGCGSRGVYLPAQ